MAKVTGQVFKAYDKAWGNKVLYSLKLEDDPIFYRMNENRGAGIVEPGNWIEFEADPNSDGKSATVKGPPKLLPKPAAAAAPSGGAVNSGGGASVRETSIHYQSARKDALQFVQIATASGAITLPAKAAGKLKALEALVDYYTALYFEDIGTGGAVTRAQEAAYSEDAPKGKAKAKDEDDEGGSGDE